jgi:predicted GTPase
MLAAASEPGLSDGELDVAAYKMDLADRRKTKAEGELQNVITRLQVIDATIDVLGQRKELEKKGIWKSINDIPEDKLQQQLEEFAVERKESVLNVNKIAEMLETDPLTVKSHRTAGMRRARAAIEDARTGRS